MNNLNFFDKVFKTIARNKSRHSVSAVLTPLFVDCDVFWHQIRSRSEGEYNALFIGPISAGEFIDKSRCFDKIILSLEEAGVINESFDKSKLQDAASLSIFFSWMKEFVDISNLPPLVIGVDAIEIESYNDLHDLYSSQRKFCTEWKKEEVEFEVHFISLGNWVPTLLQKEYFTSISWPFDYDKNLHYFPDLTDFEIFDLLTEHNQFEPKRIHSQYLWELTRGDRMTINYLLLENKQPLLNCEEIFKSCLQIIEGSHAFVSMLELKLKVLSENAKEVLSELLDGYWRSISTRDDLAEELMSSGLVERYATGPITTFRFKNWVTESAIRHHKEQLSHVFTFKSFGNYREIIPPVTCLNRSAYAYICEIENLLRNDIILRLSIINSSEHPLMGINTSRSVAEDLKRIERIKKKEARNESVSEEEKKTISAYEIAKKWRDEIANNKYVDAHASLVSYIQTIDLLNILNTLATRKDVWANHVKFNNKDTNALKEIRDVVMHNQVITEASYDFLEKVRDDLYKALIKK